MKENDKQKKILITGAAGFIGYHVVKRLLKHNYTITGLDSINDYYDPELKYARLNDCGIQKENIKWNSFTKSKYYRNFEFIRINIEDYDSVIYLFKKRNFDYICHLAAQVGVRNSINNPHHYISSNIMGFLNILEGIKSHNIKHLVYASSSSVYGNKKEIPHKVSDNVDNPVSLYAATKKSNELMAYTYSHLYKIPTTGLRFFTVYGPWGRPDMAPFLFTKAILNNKPIKVFNHGNLKRDFTYIDDIVEGVTKIISKPPSKQEIPRYSIFNIGNSKPIKLLDFIETIEKILDKKALKEFHPMQPGDVKTTQADVSDLENKINYRPNTPLNEGIKNFIKWYTDFYS